MNSTAGGREHIHVGQGVAERLADAITQAAGSWAFLLAHVAWFGYWIARPVEPYPFGLLTMIVSLEAIGLSTVVMMGQNRQAARDRRRDDHEADEVSELARINERQMKVLVQQSRHMGMEIDD